MKTLVDLYTSMAKVAHWVVDKEGYISKIRGPKKSPVFAANKRLVMPTDEQLATDGSETTIFHPLYEYLTRGEPEVMSEFRRAMSDRFHMSFLALASELITIASSQPMHELLSPEQSEFLSFVPDADQTMLDTFEKLVDSMPEDQNQKVFCSIFLRRGGVIDGKSYNRVAIVSFPLYKQLVEDGEAREQEMAARKNRAKNDKTKKDLPPVVNETYGVQMRAKDREAFIKLFEYMLPNINVPDWYSVGSDSDLAPFTSALMHAAEKLGGPLNDLVARFENRLPEAACKVLKVEDAWVPEFINLSKWQVEIHKTPAQAGNEGRSVNAKELTSSKAAAAQAARNLSAREDNPHQTSPSHVGEYVTKAEEEEVHLPAGFRLPPVNPNAVRPQPVAPLQMPAYQPAAAQYPQAASPYVDPRMQQQQPVHHQQHQQHQQHQGGPDFMTLLRTIPGLAQAAAPGMFQGQQMPMGQQPQVDRPSWDANPTYGTQRPAGFPQMGGAQPSMGPAGGMGYDPYRPKF